MTTEWKFCEKWLKFYNLLSHLRSTHGEEGREEARFLSEEEQKTVACTVDGCSFTSSSEEGLRKHIGRAHPSLPKKSGHSISCPIYCEEVADQKAFVTHCRICHDDDACLVLSTSLPDEDAFEVVVVQYRSRTLLRCLYHSLQRWKESTEKGFSTFWKEVTVVKRGNYVIKYFNCSRAGRYVPRGKGLRVTRKTVTATKYCTSFVKAKFWTGGGVDVRFCTRHCGHSLSTVSFPLSKSDKEEIARYLQLRIPVQSIRRALWIKCTGPSHRLYFTTAADIRNVESSLSLQPGRLDDDDLVSVTKRFNLQLSFDAMRRLDLPESGNDGCFCIVIITPEQEKLLKEFCAHGVSIDDTHCTTRYQIKLSTLMVADNDGRGLQVAFMISYKVDTEQCVKLFEEVQKLYPEFGPSCFLSDDTQILLEAVPNIIRDHYIKDSRGLSEGKHRGKENMRRHKAAVLAHDSVTLCQTSESQWQINSFSRGRYKITIRSCTCASELAHCILCAVCPTTVTCSCPDSVKIGVSCKHAHAWALNHDESASVDEGFQAADDVAENESTSVDDVQDLEATSISTEFVSKRDERKELLASINCRLDRLSALALTLSLHEETEDVMRKLDEDLTEIEGKQCFHEHLVPRRGLCMRGRCYGHRQKQTLERRFEKLVKRSSRRKSTSGRVEFFCDSIDTGTLDICAVCHEAEPG
ncbi:hypothetical protein ANCCAN_09610 [Ancylostoma caninum]|uniref:SWIM-type domain-containing protein n=1 Tax=Ancylostoma caninum TaxID=29170 RepID=A0A368GJ33_ANCCA|nr:hypothetical protein ANCCAN_09610 [Ancylostoma caninum]